MIIDLVKKSKSSFIWHYITEKLLKLNFDNFLHPKIFLKKFDKIEINIDDLYFYAKNFPETKWMKEAQLMNNRAYQSNHDLQKNKKFFYVKSQIENFLNHNIKKYFINNNSVGKFAVKNMWFVIMKENTTHDIHTHPKSVLSGVIYLKKNKTNEGKLNLLIPNFNKEKYAQKELSNYINEETILVNFNENKEEENYINTKSYKFNPNEKDMIVFNSYLYHSVENYSGKDDRISLAWDAVYTL